MKAGIPKEVTSVVVNMLCGSGLKAVVLGAQAIRCGSASIVVAGGQESMSQVQKLTNCLFSPSLPPSLPPHTSPSRWAGPS